MSTRFYFAEGPGGYRGKKFLGEKECQVMGGKRPGGKKSVKSWEEKYIGGKRVSSHGRKFFGGKKSGKCWEE